MSTEDINALIDGLLILQEREDEINPHPEELHRTAEKAARLIEEWAMRLDWQQRDLERMRLLTREHGEPVSSPWANSRIHESEELLQKVQQLERENAEQCVLLGRGGERECALLGKVERLERENAALREACKPVAVPGLHGLVTWYADAQQLGEAFQREREKCIRFEEVMQSQGDEIRRLTVENDALREELEDAPMIGLGVALKAHAADLSELERENAALRADKERLDCLEEHGEPVTYEDAPHALVWCVFGDCGQRSIRDAIDAARAKEGQL